MLKCIAVHTDRVCRVIRDNCTFFPLVLDNELKKIRLNKVEVSQYLILSFHMIYIIKDYMPSPVNQKIESLNFLLFAFSLK